ncbi:unnamed protein product [Protopolystoma xenopodis]|uniref:NAD(+) ADP-ribosyltransferase n=1 Tax=Protopolystoma xenopodis TaxID=117903 RepID=A0A3S4ZZ94_9PLAT|nr:unnamed protein product [Protopolystoma xenopodis]
MSLICDLRNMEETIAELKYDAKRSPLGKLTNSQIKAGYDALKRVSDAIDKILHIQKSDSIGPNVDHPLNPDDIDMTARVRRPKRASSNAGALRKARDDLLIACNQFYTRIPHDFG